MPAHAEEIPDGIMEREQPLLTNLELLDLGYTQVSNVSALKGLTNLQQLYLRGTKVSDISELKGVHGLQIIQ